MVHQPPAAQTAREAAVRQLNRIDIGGAYMGLAGEDALDARDERLATEYVAGVTRWRRRLDSILAHFYQGPYDDMEPTLKQILRVGLYDLLYLDTPPHAALNEAVELAKRLVRPKAGGLVNGMLRAILRQRDRLPEPDATDPAEVLAIRYSHPTWLVRRWLVRFGPSETEALLQWNNERPVYGLRINTNKVSVEAFRAQLDDAGIAWEPSPYLDEFVRLPRLQPVLRSGWLEEGLCAVQDESAGLIVHLLDPQPGETIIDACAAPGGKSLYAATRMRDQGTLLAFDVHAGRLRMVEQAAQDQGLSIVATEAADLRTLAQRETPPVADRVLLDAPCSGLGVLAKRADLRWNRDAAQLDELSMLQDDLLHAAAALVCDGGLLVYSTCTIAPEENEARIDAFLTRHPEYSVEPAEGWVPAALVSSDGYFATLPHVHHVDGAFGARLRKA